MSRVSCSNEVVSSEEQPVAEAKKPDVQENGNGDSDRKELPAEAKDVDIKQGDEKHEQKTAEGTEVTQKTSAEAIVDTPACIAAQP